MLSYDHFSIQQATELQLSMRKEIVLKPLDKTITTIGGADISYNKDSLKVFAGIVVLEYPSMKLHSYSLYEYETTFLLSTIIWVFVKFRRCFWLGNN